MRLGIVGSRDWANRKLFFKHVGAWHKKYGEDLHLVSGGAPSGADNLAESFTRQRGLSITIHHADWEGEGKAAGFNRNTKIVEDSDVVLAFWDFSSRGTGDTLTKCRRREPHRLMYAINPAGRVHVGREVWGEPAGPEYEEFERRTIRITSSQLTVARCRAHPDTFYLFGDNLERKGRAGQAVIRGEPNAIGMVTKCYPDMDDFSFFSDADFELHKGRILRDLEMIPVGAKVVVHEGIGAGLAQLPTRAPRLYAFLCEILGMDNRFA